jgi:hypothetical protein
MSRRRATPATPPLHRARIAGHRVERWIIPPSEIKVPAVSVGHACKLVVYEAHRRAGVPPWCPFVRASQAHASAERIGKPWRLDRRTP